jgi:hypothetical protein
VDARAAGRGRIGPHPRSRAASRQVPLSVPRVWHRVLRILSSRPLPSRYDTHTTHTRHTHDTHTHDTHTHTHTTHTHDTDLVYWRDHAGLTCEQYALWLAAKRCRYCDIALDSPSSSTSTSSSTPSPSTSPSSPSPLQRQKRPRRHSIKGKERREREEDDSDSDGDGDEERHVREAVAATHAQERRQVVASDEVCVNAPACVACVAPATHFVPVCRVSCRVRVAWWFVTLRRRQWWIAVRQRSAWPRPSWHASGASRAATRAVASSARPSARRASTSTAPEKVPPSHTPPSLINPDLGACVRVCGRRHANGERSVPHLLCGGVARGPMRAVELRPLLPF